MGDGENLGRKENKKREVSVREIKRQREREGERDKERRERDKDRNEKLS